MLTVLAPSVVSQEDAAAMEAGAAAGAAAVAAAAAAAAACGAGTWANVMTRLPANATTQLSHCARDSVSVQNQVGRFGPWWRGCDWSLEL